MIKYLINLNDTLPNINENLLEYILRVLNYSFTWITASQISNMESFESDKVWGKMVWARNYFNTTRRTEDLVVIKSIRISSLDNDINMTTYYIIDADPIELMEKITQAAKLRAFL